METLKKDEFFAISFKRVNGILNAILGFFLAICSPFRLILEVFLKTSMGWRYFAFSHAIMIAVVLAAFPVIRAQMNRYGGDSGLWATVYENISWYLFIAAFIAVSLARNRESKKTKGEFDLTHFSLAQGKTHKFFFRCPWSKDDFNYRQVETLVEPTVCAIIGLFLIVLKMPVGFLIIVCSIVYALSKSAAYNIAEDIIQDKIDIVVCQGGMMSLLVLGEDPEDTTGFRMNFNPPKDPNIGKKVYSSIFEDEDLEDVT